VNTLTVILTAIAALGGLSGIAAFISARSAARKNDVDALDEIIDNLREEIASLRGKCDKLTAEYETLDAQYHKLQRQYNDVLAWAKARGYCPPEGG
jgi:chromosome segregation ATPase